MLVIAREGAQQPHPPDGSPPSGGRPVLPLGNLRHMPLGEELRSAPAGTSFESTDPATGAVVGIFPVHDADDVRAAVARARPAAEAWAALGFDGRRTRLDAWRGTLARRLHELADLVHRENGKPHADAILEITLAIDHLAWAGAHAKKTLGPRGSTRACWPPTTPRTWSTSRSASSA